MLNLPKAILFDMDGTLTTPNLDYARIKADMGIGNAPILESLATMAADRRLEAEAVLQRHEDEAAASSTLNRGCVELLEWLAEHEIKVALITRNRRTSVQMVLQLHGLAFDVCITREDGPPKPDAAPLLQACEQVGVTPAETWMVGDGQHDVEAGLAAGMTTIWLSHHDPRFFDAVPTISLPGLPAVSQLLQHLAEIAELIRTHGLSAE